MVRLLGQGQGQEQEQHRHGDGCGHQGAGSPPAPVQRVYRTEFAGSSLGTEQELIGVKVAKARNTDSHIAEVLDNAGHLLLEVTTDIGGQQSFRGYYDYTLEMKAAPTEVADQQGWAARRRAFRAVVELFDAAADAGGTPLTSRALGEEFQLVVRNQEHLVHSDFGHGVSGSSDQVTLGIRAQDVGSDLGEAGLMAAGAFWYDREIGSELPVEGLIDAVGSRTVYSYVMSVLRFLASLIRENELSFDGAPESYRKNLYDSDIKNRWSVLPRTPPWDLLDILAATDSTAVKVAIAKTPPPPGIDPTIWKAARQHINTRQSLAGHDQPTPLIAGGQGALFEFRSSVPPAFGHALHGAEHQAAAPQGQAPSADFAEVMRQRRARLGSDSGQSDSDEY
ncbi:hypothetical protein GCM10009665_45420 [Kitasatospora nipponensis]|uniref:ACD domain-containing protein n=1 Tax=Kitasatospora nipponensis TaxID=258049 RepID=A0ABN1WGC4_9ACTN